MVDEIEDPRRVDPPFVNDERSMLEAWLECHRTTLLIKCEGLDDDGLRARPVATSVMSLHGLVRHMAEVERNWFRRVLAGEDLPAGMYWSDDEPRRRVRDPGRRTFADDLAVWQEQSASQPAPTPPGTTSTTPASARASRARCAGSTCHMIEEYARHNGHADLIRELVDGAVGA